MEKRLSKAKSYKVKKGKWPKHRRPVRERTVKEIKFKCVRVYLSPYCAISEQVTQGKNLVSRPYDEQFNPAKSYCPIQ